MEHLAIFLSYNEVGNRHKSPSRRAVDCYPNEYTQALEAHYQHVRTSLSEGVPDSVEFHSFTGKEPHYHEVRHTGVAVPHGGYVQFFRSCIPEYGLCGVQCTPTGKRHVYRVLVTDGTYRDPVTGAMVAVEEGERTPTWGWLETKFDVSPLHAFRRFAVPCNDPRWRVFPKDIQVALEAALAGTSPVDTQPTTFVHESLTFSLGGPALEGNGELGTFQCGDFTFLVKRLFQTEAFVVADRTRRKQAFDKEVASREAAGKAELDPTCPICQDALCDGPYRVLECGHAGHLLCLLTWRDRCKREYQPVTCCICREPYTL